jgi:hypothetical protein
MKSGGKKLGKKPVVGRKPETLSIPGDWKLAIKKSLLKKKPKNGWPK